MKTRRQESGQFTKCQFYSKGMYQDKVHNQYNIMIAIFLLLLSLAASQDCKAKTFIFDNSGFGCVFTVDYGNTVNNTCHSFSIMNCLWFDNQQSQGSSIWSTCTQRCCDPDTSYPMNRDGINSCQQYLNTRSSDAVLWTLLSIALVCIFLTVFLCVIGDGTPLERCKARCGSGDGCCQCAAYIFTCRCCRDSAQYEEPNRASIRMERVNYFQNQQRLSNEARVQNQPPPQVEAVQAPAQVLQPQPSPSPILIEDPVWSQTHTERSGSQGQCGMCLSRNGSVMLKCGHCFHRFCIQQGIQASKRCPLCRSTDMDSRIYCQGCYGAFYECHLLANLQKITSCSQYCNACRSNTENKSK